MQHLLIMYMWRCFIIIRCFKDKQYWKKVWPKYLWWKIYFEILLFQWQHYLLSIVWERLFFCRFDDVFLSMSFDIEDVDALCSVASLVVGPINGNVLCLSFLAASVTLEMAHCGDPSRSWREWLWCSISVWVCWFFPLSFSSSFFFLLFLVTDPLLSHVLRFLFFRTESSSLGMSTLPSTGRSGNRCLFVFWWLWAGEK